MAFFIASFSPGLSCSLTCNLKITPVLPKLTSKGYTAATNRVSINA
jgi:hypothetical protein